MISFTKKIYTSRDRVRKAGPDSVNESIDRHLMDRLHHLSPQSQEAIDQRLAELEQEWSFDRLMGAQAAVVGLSGLWLAATDDRGWVGMSAFSLLMLLLYALFGWCPPVQTLRRFNIRTEQEINLERYALKAMRGDFGSVDRLKGRKKAEAAYRAARAGHSLEARS